MHWDEELWDYGWDIALYSPVVTSVFIYYFCFPAEALLQNRPLPDKPFDLLGDKWMSRENLLASFEESDDPNLFVALYDFEAGEENQISVSKGVCVRLNSNLCLTLLNIF